MAGPRLTQDADFAVTAVDARAMVEAFVAADLQARCEFAMLRVGGLLLSRVVVLGCGAHHGHNVLDGVAARDVAFMARVLQRRIVGQLAGAPAEVVSPEDYALLKALSDRPIDCEDAASVLVRMGDALDLALIRREVEGLSRTNADHPTLLHWPAIEARVEAMRAKKP